MADDRNFKISQTEESLADVDSEILVEASSACMQAAEKAVAYEPKTFISILI